MGVNARPPRKELPRLDPGSGNFFLGGQNLTSHDSDAACVVAGGLLRGRALIVGLGLGVALRAALLHGRCQPIVVFEKWKQIVEWNRSQGHLDHASVEVVMGDVTELGELAGRSFDTVFFDPYPVTPEVVAAYESLPRLMAPTSQVAVIESIHEIHALTGAGFRPLRWVPAFGIPLGVFARCQS